MSICSTLILTKICSLVNRRGDMSRGNRILWALLVKLHAFVLCSFLSLMWKHDYNAMHTLWTCIHVRRFLVFTCDYPKNEVVVRSLRLFLDQEFVQSSVNKLFLKSLIQLQPNSSMILLSEVFQTRNHGKNDEWVVSDLAFRRVG